MIAIEQYVAGLNMSGDKQQAAIGKLREAGYTRYDRYHWQQIEDIVSTVKGDKSHEQIKP